jgi:hypothetical protein
LGRPEPRRACRLCLADCDAGAAGTGSSPATGNCQGVDLASLRPAERKCRGCGPDGFREWHSGRSQPSGRSVLSRFRAGDIFFHGRALWRPADRAVGHCPSWERQPRPIFKYSGSRAGSSGIPRRPIRPAPYFCCPYDVTGASPTIYHHDGLSRPALIAGGKGSAAAPKGDGTNRGKSLDLL